MVFGGYDAFEDPYSYKNTTVLKNKLGIRDAAQLESFELEMTTLRSSEPLPQGRFEPRDYRRVHHHIFQDVYSWAGKYRTVRTSKNGNPFCFPENIENQMDRLFATLDGGANLTIGDSAIYIQRAAAFLAELNAIHPFREGNGRAQLTFLAMLGDKAGHPFDLTRVRRETFLPAMIASYDQNLDPLIGELTALLR